MKDNWLETGLNDKFENFGSPIDLDEAWRALEEKRKPSRKKRRFLIWWGMGATLLICGYFFLDRHNDQLVTSPGIKRNMIVEFNTKTESSTFETNVNSINTEEVLNNNSASTDINQLDILENDQFENIKIEKTKTIDGRQRSTEIGRSYPDNSVMSSFEKPESKDRESFGGKEKSAIEPLNDFGNIASIPSAKFIKEAELLFVNKLLHSILDEEPNLDLSNEPRYFDEVITYYAKPRLPQLVGISSGYSFLSKGKTLQTERSLDAFSFNLFYQKNISKRLYLKSGIEWNRFVNKIELSTTKSYMENKDGQILVINIFQNGTEELLYGNADVEINETTNFELFNRYSFINIPLIFGMELFSTKRSSFQIESGLSVSIIGKYNGRFLAGNSSEVLTSLNSLELREIGLMNGLYAMQWNYAPFERNENWEFFASYRGSFQLNNISNDKTLNVQKFRAQQIALGLQYQFK